MLDLTTEEREQIAIMDRFLAALDPQYVEKMFEQLRIMGVLREGTSGDPGLMSYEVFSTLVQQFQDQGAEMTQLRNDIQELKIDMASAVKIIHALIPKDPFQVASGEYSFFSKHNLYIN